MNPIIEEFTAWLHNEDRGEKTIRTYRSVLASFIAWAEETEGAFSLEAVTPLLLQDYRAYLQNTKGQKPATINKALATLKIFFAWAVQEKGLPINPAAKVRMKRIQTAYAPRWLTEAEQNRLLYAVETEKNEWKRARDRVIVLLMLKAGLRVEEVSELQLSHVDLQARTVTVVNGKGGKYRGVPMHDELRKALKVWLSYRKESDKPVHRESPYLLLSERSGHMTPRGIAFRVDHYLERCGLLERSPEGKKRPGQPSCHALRHTFCKSLVNAGVPIQEVARLAGHDSIQTTLRYVEPSQADLVKAIQAI